jgi:hypothetical protein
LKILMANFLLFSKAIFVFCIIYFLRQVRVFVKRAGNIYLVWRENEIL